MRPLSVWPRFCYVEPYTRTLFVSVYRICDPSQDVGCFVRRDETLDEFLATWNRAPKRFAYLTSDPERVTCQRCRDRMAEEVARSLDLPVTAWVRAG